MNEDQAFYLIAIVDYDMAKEMQDEDPEGLIELANEVEIYVKKLLEAKDE